MSGLSKRTGRNHEITSELEWFRAWRGWRPQMSSAPGISSFRDCPLNRKYGLLRTPVRPAGGTARDLIDEWLPLRSRQSQCRANFWFENPHQVSIPADIVVRNVKH